MFLLYIYVLLPFFFSYLTFPFYTFSLAFSLKFSGNISSFTDDICWWCSSDEKSCQSCKASSKSQGGSSDCKDDGQICWTKVDNFSIPSCSEELKLFIYYALFVMAIFMCFWYSSRDRSFAFQLFVLIFFFFWLVFYHEGKDIYYIGLTTFLALYTWQRLFTLRSDPMVMSVCKWECPRFKSEFVYTLFTVRLFLLMFQDWSQIGFLCGAMKMSGAQSKIFIWLRCRRIWKTIFFSDFKFLQIILLSQLHFQFLPNFTKLLGMKIAFFFF